jgi:RHS repeat-associated protein
MTTQIHVMRSFYLKAAAVVLGMLPVTLACLAFAAAVIPAHVAHATGPCRWQGGDGDPTYPECAAVDCKGRGGEADCPDGIPLPPPGYTDAQVGPEKWVYTATDNYYNPIFTNPYWCWAAGGSWVDGANPTCVNFPPGLPSERMANDEGRILSLAETFANMWLGHMNCGSASLVSDTDWVLPTTYLGKVIGSQRTRHYVGMGCNPPQSIDIVFVRTRSAQCPATAQFRVAVTGPECVIPEGCAPVMLNPVSLVTGAKIQREADYISPADTGLELSRYYRSNRFFWPTYLTGTNAPERMANTDYWQHSYERSFIPVSGNSEVSAIVRMPDCVTLVFDTSGVEKTRRGGTDGTGATLTAAGGGWDLKLANSDVEHYDSAARLASITQRTGRVTTLTYAGPDGKLSTVTGPFGHTLTFGYDANKLLASVTLPGGGVIAYGYDAYQRLNAVTYPDGKSRSYGYGNAVNPWLLTSITDENGVQFASFTYDAQGRVIAESHAGGADAASLAYSNSGGVISTTVTDPNGAVTQFVVANAKGMYRPGSYSAQCADCGSVASRTYDAGGNTSASTDFNGNQTVYTYDTTRNLETSRTEAFGTPRARTISTQWHPTFRSPTQIDEPGRRTNYAYDSNGNVLTRTITDTATSVSRTWTYTYTGLGQVTSVDGPRTDVSDTMQRTYYSCTSGGQCGEVATITDAAGNVTTFSSYNAGGQPLTITDPNGTVTTLTYDARQRLTSKTVGGEMTQMEYWPTGQLKKVTQPDGTFVSYDYDAAHRLTKITDTDGNSIVYTLDGAGNRIAEQTYDAQQTLIVGKTRTFSTLGRLVSEIGSAGQTVSYGYDGAGNRTYRNDPLGRVTSYAYDEINRIATVTDATLAATQYSYDALDDQLSVSDPRSLTTSYAYNGFGDKVSITSPDTGVSAYARNAAGNLDVATDARGKSSSYHYDALDRVTQIVRTDQTMAYTYDQGATGRGHLTGMQDGSGTTAWIYDGLGRVTQRTETIGTVSLSVGYTYDSLGHLATVTTPSGRTIAYSYTNGKVSALAVNGSNVVQGVTYSPFGPTTGWQWGNGASTSRTYDTDRQLVQLSSAGASTYTYFADGLIKSRADDFTASIPLAAGAITYAVSSTSNRLQSATGLLNRSYSYDASGNTVGDGSRTFSYDDSGRMKTSTSSGVTTTYSYNGLGERVKKSSSTATVYFAYDESGHLIGEYDSSGSLLEETVWLGNIPVATLRPSGGSSVHIYYVHTDHLNTPRRVTDSVDNTIVWRWDSDPYGATPANEDPDGNSTTFTYNLRFAGQYSDAETGLNYNRLRDYDPAVGVYTESDPIGLKGGSYSTYRYVGSEPLTRTDPNGLQIEMEGERDHEIYKDVPDTYCDLFGPARCINAMKVCTKAECKEKDVCGKEFTRIITAWLPGPAPTPDEVHEAAPNCVCTVWKFRKGE